MHPFNTIAQYILVSNFTFISIVLKLDNTEKALDDAKLAAKDSERQISQLQAAQDTERLEIEKKHKQALKVSLSVEM